MKKVNRGIRDVSQHSADLGTEIVERHFNIQRVQRAADLSEEGKVALFRKMQLHLAKEGREIGEWKAPKGRVRGFFLDLWAALCFYFR